MPEENGTTTENTGDPGQQTQDTNGNGAVTQTQGNDGTGKTGSDQTQSNDPFADLDGDTREWLGKKGVKSPQEAAKLAHDQAKLLGNAIRVPGEKATDEEKAEFLNKLGRPESPDKYEFEVPKNLPEDVPYDAERADSFKQLAHSIGLTAQQAAALHDWAAENTVNDFKSFSESQQAQTETRAKEETEKLVKRWGPLDSQTMRANVEFADRALKDVGGPELVAEFQRLKLIGPNKEILSEPLAVAFANMGMALYKEDDVLRGNPDKLANPFADGESFNLTKAMKLYKEDPDNALSLIAAAGKKPSDFGIKTK